jgi:four helix bundle protein
MIKTMEKLTSHRDLKVYQAAFKTALTIFERSKRFPKEETYSLTDQIRRSSRSVCANVSEAFRRRKYPKSFCNKLNESEAEAAETQNWLDFALQCHYITEEDHVRLNKEYEHIIGMLVTMQRHPDKWSI